MLGTYEGKAAYTVPFAGESALGTTPRPRWEPLASALGRRTPPVSPTSGIPYAGSKLNNAMKLLPSAPSSVFVVMPCGV